MTTRLMYSYVFMIRPILVPKVRHLRDLHTFSLVTSLELLIQLRPREIFINTTRGDGVDEVTDAGLRLSIATI